MNHLAEDLLDIVESYGSFWDRAAAGATCKLLAATYGKRKHEVLILMPVDEAATYVCSGAEWRRAADFKAADSIGVYSIDIGGELWRCDTGRGEMGVVRIDVFDVKRNEWRSTDLGDYLDDSEIFGYSLCNFNGHLVCAGVSNVHMLDTKTETWSSLAPLPERRYGHCCCECDGHLFLVGGSSRLDWHNQRDDEIWVYDALTASTRSWTTFSQLPREMGSMRSGVAVLGHCICIMARWDDDSDDDDSDDEYDSIFSMNTYIFVLDVRTRAWSVKDPEHSPTQAYYMKVHVFGGDITLVDDGGDSDGDDDDDVLPGRERGPNRSHVRVLRGDTWVSAFFGGPARPAWVRSLPQRLARTDLLMGTVFV